MSAYGAYVHTSRARAMLIIEIVAARPPSLKVVPLPGGAGRGRGRGRGFLSLLLPLPSLLSGREWLILAAGLVKHGEVVTRNPYGRRH